jgi:pantoate--beta-alanine ligase
MKTIYAPGQMIRASRGIRANGKTIGFVPTMGYLHEGHLSLVRESRKKTDTTIVSIFVNPAQFGPGEDYKAYPRDLVRDSALLKNEGVDLLFFPDAKAMYPPGYRTYIEVTGLQDKLCGRMRPGHFRGVCTVVLKLFEIVRPDVAFFGQKDAQQVLIIKKMVKDLDLGIKVEALPIIREPDGLALSSRNRYLRPEERKAALILSRSLKEAERLISRGEKRADKITEKIKAMIGREPLARIDYAEIVNGRELDPVRSIREGALIALAVFIGKTRLIDNLVIGP